MRKLGRNDPCHCGSGKKYKKCCLAQDEASSVTRLTSSQAVGRPPTVAEFVEEQLEWQNVLHQLIARHFVNHTIGRYKDEEVAEIASLWNEYANTTNPLTKKAGVYPAALEYLLCQVYGYDTTQNELSAKYDVSPGVISQRSNQLLAFAEEWSDEQAEGGLETPLSVRDARISMDRASSSRSGGAGKNNKKTRAAELLYDALEESDPKKRVEMAQDALLLDPDSADAYNILAECAASSAKEMAYYYEQGMRAGERELGEKGFEEYKGHFWGFTPTRPYMRAKKGYADACAEMHNMPEAIKHYKELLELNPGDNQGVRDSLLLAYQETGDWKAADALIRQYDEASAVFDFSRIIVEYGRKPNSPKLPELVKAAHLTNKHVIPLLLGKTKLPARMPEYYGFGDKNEAVMYVHMAKHLWLSRPELLQLLQANSGKGK